MIILFAFLRWGHQWLVYPSSLFPKPHKTWTSPATILFSRRRHSRSSARINIEAKFKAKDLDRVDKNVLQKNLTTAMQKSETTFKNFSYNLDINEEQIASRKPTLLYVSISPSLPPLKPFQIKWFVFFLWCFIFSSRAPIFILLFSGV